jgi:hypothetical protein
MLLSKKFKQYRLAKDTGVTFSLVNRIVNWFVSRGFVAKRTGFYELITPGAVFNLFPLYRKMKPTAVFDVNVQQKELLALVRGKGALCLTSSLSFYDDYYRDPAVYFYLKDEKLLEELKRLPKGYTRVEVFKEDLNANDFEKKNGQLVTNKVRTVIDLFCAGKAYAAERLVKQECG